MSRLFVVIAGFYLRRQVVFPLSLVLHFNFHLVAHMPSTISFT